MKMEYVNTYHPNGCHFINLSSGDSDVDRKDILFAARSVHKAREQACSNLFWEKMESFLAPVTVEDLWFLKRQINQTGLLMLTPVPEAAGGNLNQGSVKATDFGQPEAIKSLNVVPPLYQIVLSALIDECEVKESHKVTSNNFPCTSDDFYKKMMEPEVPSGLDLLFEKGLLQNRLCSGSAASNTSSKKGASNTFPSDEWQADGLFEYQALSLDEKVFLELQSIGLSSGAKPPVDAGEAWIDREIKRLQRELYQQAAEVKSGLERIEASINSKLELEKRSLEESVMDQLVLRAYKRTKVSQASRRSKSSKARKVPKEADVAFASRTLARCKQFEDSGRSCFSVEPANGLMNEKEAPKKAKRKRAVTGPVLKDGRSMKLQRPRTSGVRID